MNAMQFSLWKNFAGCMSLLFAASTGHAQAIIDISPAATDAAIAQETRLKLPAPKNGRKRPLVVVLADNAGTETTDFIVPYGVLKESGVADVLTVSTEPGTVALHPALRIRADLTTAQFDAQTPEGTDILIVPAMHKSDAPALLSWVRAQSEKGATVVSICDGAWVLANAGLLEGKSATTHWYALKSIDRKFPGTAWVRNRRWVIDGNVMTTTGIAASVPASLALVESIAGRPAAELTAGRLGVKAWGAEHDTAAFALSSGDLFVVARNWLALWRHETVEIPAEEGLDELSMAFIADGWSRTYRSQAVAMNASGVVRSRRGLLIETKLASNPGNHVRPLPVGVTAIGPDAMLDDIAGRYGQATANLVALLMEYRRRHSGSQVE
jgi:putative intracellular protease/amidase